MNVEYFVDLSTFISLLEEEVWYDAVENHSEGRYGGNRQDCFLRFGDIIG